MKFDKDSMLKNRFWMLFAVAMPLALVTLFLLFTAVTAGIDDERTKIESALKELDSALNQAHPNDEWIKIKEKEAEKLTSEETAVWRRAYEVQEHDATWPKEFDKQFHYSNGLFVRAVEVLKKVDNEKEFFNGEVKPDDGKEFHGILQEFDEEWLKVKGFDKERNLVTRTFQRTQELKVSIEGDSKPFFRDLQNKEKHAVKVTYEQSRYFDDPLTTPEIKLFADTYRSQIPEILEQVNPVNYKGEGIVQLRGWPYVKGQIPPAGAPFLRYKADEWNVKSETFSSEVWLAQEDLWVQREIYRMVRQANEYVSKFRSIDGKEFNGGSEIGKTYTLVNPNWKVEVTWRGGKDVDLKVYNQLGRRQKVDVGFRIQTNKNAFVLGEVITPSSEPLSPRGTKGLDVYTKKHSFDTVPQGIFGLEQVLNWETAAVKRVDFISLGSQDVSHSHRTYPQMYKPLKPAPVVAAATEGAEGAAATPAAPAQGAPGAGPGPGPGRGGFGDGAAVNANVSPNGFVLERYQNEVTKEARRIPVAVVLIVDQEHIDRVHTSFVNSKLRFLMTQCIMSRYPGSLRPVVSLDGGTLAGGSGIPGSPFGGMPGPGAAGPGGSAGEGGRGGEPGGRFGGGFAPPGAGAPGAGEGGMQPPGSGLTADPTAADETEANVELNLYGIVTLYQRYPPRPLEQAVTEQPKDAAKEQPKTTAP